MVTPFCGSCIADIRDGSDHRVDGVRLCTSCATDDIMSVDNKRGYTGGEGGIGAQFMRDLSDKHDAIVPAAVVKLDRQISLIPETPRLADPNYRKGQRASSRLGRRG